MAKSQRESDTKIVADMRKFISDSKQHTSDRQQKDRARIYQGFFRGGTHQWTQDEFELYKERGVDPITINRCKPVLKGLLGMYLQSKQDVRVSPRRGGSATVAQVWTEVLKHTQDVSYADYVYAQVFMRGGIDSESYLKLEIDRGQNVGGQPVIKGRSVFQVSIDRNAIEYDLNESCKYIIERIWKDQDELNAEYPTKENDIKAAIATVDDTDKSLSDRLATYMVTDQGDIDFYDQEDTDVMPDLHLLQKYRYLVHHIYWKEVLPGLVVSDHQDEKITIVTDEKKIAKLSRKAKKSKRFDIYNYPVKVLHETIMLGADMLEDIPNPLGEGVTDYPIVRYSPMWDEGFAVGVLDDVVSLNREENIHRTQGVRILNQTANGGWIAGSTNDPGAARELRNFGSVPGIVIPRDKFGGFLEKILPNPLPAHYIASTQFEQDIKRVSGVDDASQGYETGKADSGRALAIKQSNNRQANEIFFDNFYRSIEIFGNLLMQVNLKNKLYTDDEIRAIVEESSLLDAKKLAQAKARITGNIGADLPEPQPLPPVDPAMMQLVRPEDQGYVLEEIQAGAQGAQQYTKAFPQLQQSWEEVIKAEAVEEMLKELRADQGQYGIKVTLSDSAPTERMSRFLQMDALLTKYGQLIPPDIFIDLTDLPNKEEIKARLLQAQQAQQPAAA